MQELIELSEYVDVMYELSEYVISPKIHL